MVVIIAGAALHHTFTPAIYDYAPARPFSGNEWYNPYAASESAPGDWLRCNFHAHTHSWGGVTNGEQTVPEMFDFYRSEGYDVVGISNYQSIRPALPGEQIYISAYEHGYSARYHHQTVLGASSVSWFDYPLFQERRHKQHVLDVLGEDAEFLILNHPDRSDAYSIDDMRKLTGFQAIEIFSRFADAQQYWDAALTAGRRVWGIASDDCHNIERPTQAVIGWLSVGAGERTPHGIFEALRAGRFVSVTAKNHEAPNRLLSCVVAGETLRVTFAEPTEFIRFVGEHGVQRAEVQRVASAEYRLRPEDPYLRVVAQTRGTRLYLNPVFRHGGDAFSELAATVRPLATWSMRGVGLFGFGLTVLVVFRVLGRKSKSRVGEPARFLDEFEINPGAAATPSIPVAAGAEAQRLRGRVRNTA